MQTETGENMRKKWLCLLTTLMMCFAAVALAEDWIPIGEGEHSVLVLVKVLDAYIYGYRLQTPEERLLDALQNIGLVDGEQAADGFHITHVSGFKGVPEENGAYWTVETYSGEQARFQPTDEPIEQMGTEDHAAVAFVRHTENVPYEEKLIYVAVNTGDGLTAYELLTAGQETLLECLQDNGLAAGGPTQDGKAWSVLVYNKADDQFEPMNETLDSVCIADLPSLPQMAGYAFILSE